MSIKSIKYVLSLEFIELVRINATRSKDYIIRIAERRFIFSNPKADPITITENDIDRALSIINDSESQYDRYANVYTWFKNNLDRVNELKDDMTKLWNEYRGYVSSRGLEKLWVITNIYNDCTFVESEFKEMALGCLEA